MYKSTFRALLTGPGAAKAVVQRSASVPLAQSILQGQKPWDVSSHGWTRTHLVH